MTTLPAIGFHYGVPFDDYRAWPAVNVSTLKPIKRSPSHCKWAAENPNDSEEMDVGSATHIRILEPARFDSEFCVAPECDRRTKEGKAIWEEAEKSAAGRTVLRADGWEQVVGMSKSVWRYNSAKSLLELPGQCEVSALWKDPLTGLLCKCRFDKLGMLPSQRQVIVELKTTKDAEEWSFGSDAYKLGYAAQASYYRWAIKELTGNSPLHVIIAIEKTGPYAVAVWTLDDAALHVGANQFRHWLDRYAECKKNNSWPGYPDQVRTLSLPPYATKEN